MKRISLFIKNDQLRKLKAISVVHGASTSELIRRSIDLYVKKAR
jgi:hypothetical protein